MEEKEIQEITVESHDSEKQEQRDLILRHQSEVRATDSIAINLILAYIVGEATKEDVEQLFEERNAHRLHVEEAEAEIVRLDELGKEVEHATGDYLNPILYKDGMRIVDGKWYYLDDKDLPHEAIKSGVPAGFNDKEYFDFVE